MNFSLGHVVAVDGAHGDAHFPDGSFCIEFQRVGIVIALVLVETDEGVVVSVKHEFLVVVFPNISGRNGRFGSVDGDGIGQRNLDAVGSDAKTFRLFCVVHQHDVAKERSGCGRFGGDFLPIFSVGTVEDGVIRVERVGNDKLSDVGGLFELDSHVLSGLQHSLCG